MKNWLCNVRAGFKNQQINHKFSEYTSQSHLRRIARRYDNDASKIIFPYEGWYNFRVPHINFSVTKKDISTIAEVSSNLDLSTDTIRALLGQCGYACLVVGGMEMIRMSELNDALKRTPKRNSYFG
jgi:alpha-galactosidase